MESLIQLDDLLRLPRPERARFAKVLIDSLEDGRDDDAAQAWVTELERRALDARANPVEELEAAADWYDGERPGLGAGLVREVDRGVEAIALSPGTRVIVDRAAPQAARSRCARREGETPSRLPPGEVVDPPTPHRRPAPPGVPARGGFASPWPRWDPGSTGLDRRERVRG